MKNNTKNSAASAAQTKNQSSNSSKSSKMEQIKAAVKYCDRVRIAKTEMQSISRVWRDLCDVYGDVLAGAKFADFLSYMKGRYNIAGNEIPKYGWSVYYACQFAEKFARCASMNKGAQAYAAACAYLRHARAEKQNSKTLSF